MKNFNFETKIVYRTGRIDRPLTQSRRKEIETTDIEINDLNNISISYQKKIYITFLDLPYGPPVSTTLKSKIANLNNIEQIDYKRSKGYLATYEACLIIFIFLFFFFSLKEIIFNPSNLIVSILGHISLCSLFAISLSFIIAPFLILIGVPTRELLIKFKDKDKISFPYYNIEHQNKIKEFIEYTKYINPEIKVVNKRKPTDLIIYLILSMFICLQLFFGYISHSSKLYNLEEKNLNNAILENNCYTEERFVKLKFLGKDNVFNYNIYEDIYTGEKIKVKEDSNISKSIREYSAIEIKFYSKEDHNTLITKRYAITSSVNNDIKLEKYGKIYYYYNNKLYKFNDKVNGMTVFFDKEKEENNNIMFLNKNSLYDFIYSDAEFIDLENNKFKNYQKINTYDSMYGKCYIIKAQGVNNSNNPYYDDYNTSYIMYIEIEDSIYEGIIFNVPKKNLIRIVDSNSIINYFKNILPEKQI